MAAVAIVAIVEIAGLANPSFAADDKPAPCDAMAAEAARRIGVSVERRSEAGDEFYFGKKNDVDLRLRCPVGTQRTPRLLLDWKATYPPRSYWDAVEDAGARLTGASRRRVKLTAHRCHKASLRSANGRANIRARGLGFECHTTTTDGGSTSISVRRRQDIRL